MPTPYEDRNVIREMIRGENELRNQRLGYLLTLNGLLFAALAFAWDKSKSDALVVLLGALGLVAGASGFASMRVSSRAIRRLRNWSDQFTGPSEVARYDPDWELADPMPPVVGMRGKELDRLTRWFSPWNSLPVALSIVWIGIIVAYLAR